MKSFKDIEFNPRTFGEGLHGLIFFENGYGVSVTRFKVGHSYGSYTNNDNEWEVAIIYGDEKDWEIYYNTHITDDVIGHLSEGEVNWVMIQVQELENVEI